jgi:cytochrome c peroxidase
MGKSQLGQDLSDAEVDEVAAFLGSLTGRQPRVEVPALPPSTAATPRPEP